MKSPWKRRREPAERIPKGRGKGKENRKGKSLFAMSIARRLRGANLCKFPIEKDFNASSSRDSKASKRETVKKLVMELKEGQSPLPLTPRCLKAIASVLKLAEYKAGSAYLAEAKLWHLEEGFEWSTVLERMMKMCKRALDRGGGPRKKAPEVPETAWSKKVLAPLLKAQAMVRFAKETFLFAMVWLLREIELAMFDTSDLRFDFQGKKVTLIWRESKTDQSREGCSRVLQCNCKGACGETCPFRISLDLVSKVEKLNGTNSALCLDKKLEKASKGLVIKAWATALGTHVTGHSARRTGALRYVRSGWAISQIAYLGRWKSNVVYSYAEEALAELAVNNFKVDSQWGRNAKESVGETSPDWGEVLKLELAQFKKNVAKDMKEAKDNVVFWKELYDKKVGSLPATVISTSSRVTHRTVTASTWSPPVTWRTVCGWRFYGSNFSFLEGENVPTCTKCLQQGAIVQWGRKCPGAGFWQDFSNQRAGKSTTGQISPTDWKQMSEGWVVDCTCRARKCNLWNFLLDMFAVLVGGGLDANFGSRPPLT